MTVLSDNEIIFLIEKKSIVIEPFSRDRLTPAGYDFSAGIAFDLCPKKQALISTAEHLEMSAEILGTIHLKSSLCREAVVGSFAVIDPGFRGNLTLSLFNSGESVFHLDKNEPFIQVVFHKTSEPCKNPYKGRYQDSEGLVNSKRKEFRK